MLCAWNELLAILPVWMRREVDMLGRNNLQELRLRVSEPPELVLGSTIRYLDRQTTLEDLSTCVNTATRYSPWAGSTAAMGYITAPGGHRIGLCGEAVCREGVVTGIREVSSLCIRVARDFPGIGKSAAALDGSLLILGAPGWGKTTLLRDLSREFAKKDTVTVVDERGEIFPKGFTRGRRMDVLTGAPKSCGIEMALRTMGPDWIAVDEITAEEDCRALAQAQGCGVRLLATGHAGSLEDFRLRSVYKPLLENHIFTYILLLRPDKSYRTERMHTWSSDG